MGSKKIQTKEDMFITRDYFINILGYFYYSGLCNVITKFPELIRDMLRNGITFPLSKIKRAIEWRYSPIPALNYFVNQINKNRYNEYTFTK